jgi:hypothetical protein
MNRSHGTVNYYKHNINASRAAWIETHGPIEPPTLDVLHKCNVPLCCNPEHMYLGTDKDNSMDRLLAGTQPAILKPADVREIRKLIGLKLMKDIAAQFGVCPAVITAIKKGRLWAWVQ